LQDECATEWIENDELLDLLWMREAVAKEAKVVKNDH
jgi:hypothetical protein